MFFFWGGGSCIHQFVNGPAEDGLSFRLESTDGAGVTKHYDITLHILVS